QSDMQLFEIGKANTVKEGSKIAILSFGTLLENAQLAANELNATLVNMRFIKPLDTSLLNDIIKNHDVIVTLEDNAIA
ncbi:transketolase C-terminal domain-containing protein, partial [Cobetia sp. SIMBA_158]